MDNKTKKGSKVLLPIIIIAVIIIGIFAYIKTQSKPANVFAKEVKIMAQILKQREDFEKTKLNATITADINSESTQIEQIKKVIDSPKIALNLEEDTKKEIVKLGAKLDLKEENVVNVKAVNQDGKVYVLLGELFSKYIDVTENETAIGIQEKLGKVSQGINVLPKNEMNKFVGEIEKTITDYLKEQEYATSKEKIKIDNKDVNARKIVLVLDGKKTLELIANILETVQKNEKVVNLLKESDKDIETKINDKITDLRENAEEGEEVIEIALYTKGSSANVIQKRITLKDSSGEIADIVLTKVDANNEILTIGSATDKFTFDISKKNYKIEKITFVAPDWLKGVESYLEIKEAGKNKGILTFFLKIPEDQMENLDLLFDKDVEIKLNIEYKMDFNAKVEKEDVSNSVKLNELSNEDQEEITNNLQKSKLFTLLNV